MVKQKKTLFVLYESRNKKIVKKNKKYQVNVDKVTLNIEYLSTLNRWTKNNFHLQYKAQLMYSFSAGI